MNELTGSRTRHAFTLTGRHAACTGQRAAFTLVELLVVIGIIAVLMALLMPAMGRARKHAQQVHCAANLRTLGQAMTMYTQQYGWYPGGHHAGPRLGQSYAVWPTRLRLFTNGDRRVFRCPAQDDYCEWAEGSCPKPGEPDYRGPPTPIDRATPDEATRYGYREGELLLDTSWVWFSYGYNMKGAKTYHGLGWLVDVHHPGLTEDRKMVRAARVRRPAEMIAIADTVADGEFDFSIEPDPSFPRQHPGRVHNGGANVLFCDGHVQWYHPKEIVIARNDDGKQGMRARMWNHSNEPDYHY
jgi:prepilin-type processing-associated H-X9-DG protein/prepilin-type N-terminal cleavage/methylation domain-containing protein